MSSREDRPRESRRTPGGKAKTPVAKAKDRPSPSAKNVVAKCAPRRRLRAVDRWPDPAQILGSLADAVTAYDREWRYVYVNQKASETIGLPARELLGRSVWEVYPGAEETRSYREFHRAMAEQVSITYEEFAPGFERWFEHRLHPSPHGLVVCSRDVGERHAAESERERLLRALTESEERFRALIENGLDGVMLTDVDGTALYMSPPGVRIGGWEPREIQGRKIFDYVHAEDRSRLVANRKRLLSAPGSIVSAEYRVLSGRGRWMWLEVVQHNLLHLPSVGAIVTNFRDVTDRKNAERNLEILLDVAREIGETLDLDELLDRVRRRVATALGCDMVATFRWDEEDGLFRNSGTVGCPAELHDAFAALEFRPMEPFGGRLAEGPIVVEEGSEKTEAIAHLCAAFGIHAMVVSPVRLRGRQLGALAAIYRTPGARLATWQVELCAGVSGQLAVAIERAETHHVEQIAATTSAALAHLGRQLLSSFDRPGLLDRVCELTSEVLDCASCVTFLWRPEQDLFLGAASHGLSASRAEEVRLLGFDRASIPGLLARLAHEDAVEQAELVPAEREAIPSRLRPAPGTVLLFLALRRGTEIVGFQVVVPRRTGRRFSAAQLRIAAGASQLVSMALEHARVLDELERANHLKSEFVAMMSHELRTPLHVLLGYGDLLLDGAFGDLDREAIDVLERMRRSAHDLHQLVDDVLDLNRLDSGRIPVELQPVSPAELLAEVEARAAELDRAVGVEFIVQCDPDLPAVLTDAAKVHVVLKNLIANAFKFTETGSVTVAATLRDGGLEIEVRDTGPGIPVEHQPFVFDAFRQVDSSMTRRHGGVGLGLYIVRRMLDLVGGTVELESEPGRGSAFRVQIPDGRRPAPDERSQFQAILAAADGEAAIVSGDGTIVAVNDRWLRFAPSDRVGANDRLGVGVNYLEVCAGVRGPDALTAQEARAGLRSILDGVRDRFSLEYQCVAPRGRWNYRMDVSVIGGRPSHALVTHSRLAGPGALRKKSPG